MSTQGAFLFDLDILLRREELLDVVFSLKRRPRAASPVRKIPRDWRPRLREGRMRRRRLTVKVLRKIRTNWRTIINMLVNMAGWLTGRDMKNKLVQAMKRALNRPNLIMEPWTRLALEELDCLSRWSSMITVLENSFSIA